MGINLGSRSPVTDRSRFHWLSVVLNWIPAMLGVAVIAAESTATMSAANTSRWLLPIWVHLFGRIEARTWAEINLLLRKLGHFTGYGLLSVAFFHGWRYSLQTKGPMRPIWWLSAGLGVLCTVTVAAADEYHQTFLLGRSGSPIDVGLDFCGAIVAQCIVLAVMPCLFRPKQKDS